VLRLRQLQPYFNGGITREQQWSCEGVKPLRGSHLGFVQINKESIFSLKVTERVLEVRVTQLRQISGLSEEFSHQGEYSSLATVVV
jgi:hypothetical protein